MGLKVKEAAQLLCLLLVAFIDALWGSLRKSDKAECRLCRKVALKTEMCRVNGYGYYCSKQEAWEHWTGLQR